MINIVFTTAYISRAIMCVVDEIRHRHKENEKRPNAKFGIDLAYSIGYLFWDIIPLTLIMRYHFQNFLTEETADSEDSTTSLTESINESSSSATSASPSSNSSHSTDGVENYLSSS